jgi:type IV secretion system protein VirD4
MVSRSEIARPLLTPGEIMQLPPDDEIVMVAGAPPIRAHKARYFEDPRISERVLPPPALMQAEDQQHQGEWTQTVAKTLPMVTQEEQSETPKQSEKEANSGIRQEPVTPEHETIEKADHKMPEPTSADRSGEYDEDMVIQMKVLGGKQVNIGRQASMDHDSGMDR